MTLPIPGELEDRADALGESGTMSAVAPSPREAEVLMAWENHLSPDFGYLPFATVASEIGKDRKYVRRYVRALARKGVLQFGKGLWTDDGELAGSGYALTEEGRVLLCTMLAKREARSLNNE